MLTDRQTDRQTHTQTDRQTDGHKRVLYSCDENRNYNNKGRFFKTIEPEFDKTNQINMKNRHMEKIIYRLKTGHNLLNGHLHRIGLHISGLCDLCEEIETVKHYLLDCIKYQQFQEEITNFAIKNNIQLTIESILKNSQIYPVIYEYVIKTKREI